jgi:uncharacterized protein YunC (DUF1805 family)
VVPLVFKTSLGTVRSPEGSTPSLLRQPRSPLASFGSAGSAFAHSSRIAVIESIPDFNEGEVIEMPGTADQFGIRLSNGYLVHTRLLGGGMRGGGNVQLHEQNRSTTGPIPSPLEFAMCGSLSVESSNGRKAMGGSASDGSSRGRRSSRSRLSTGCGRRTIIRAGATISSAPPLPGV